MIDANLRRGIESRFEREAAERRGKTPEGYQPLNLNQIITQEGRLFLGVLLVELETLQGQEESEVRNRRIETIKSIVSKIESYQQNPQQEPQFTTQELQILLGTPDGKEKGVYQKVEEARLEAYRILSDFPPERLTQLANVNDNFASFLRGIGVIGPNNELLVGQEGLRDNFARILAHMLIENPNGFGNLREQVRRYNDLLNNINNLSIQIGALVETNLTRLLGERLEGLSEEERNQFIQQVQKIAFDAVVEAIEGGAEIKVENIVDKISQNVRNRMLEIGREKLGIGIREKILGSESRFREMMEEISKRLKRELEEPTGELSQRIEYIKANIEQMRDSLKVISSVLHQTFLEHGQEFVSKAILKGAEQAIGEAITGNIVDNMRETRSAIEELKKINSTFVDETGKPVNPDPVNKQKMAASVIEGLSEWARRFVMTIIPPELKYLTQPK